MLTIGSDVLVRTLKRRGVVVEVMKAGVYRVQVGAMTITAREEDLDVPAPSEEEGPSGHRRREDDPGRRMRPSRVDRPARADGR